MHLDPRAVPFSTFGSFLSVNFLFWDWAVTPATPIGWYVRSVGATSCEAFEIIPMRGGQTLPIREARAMPGHLLLDCDGGTIEVAFADPKTLLLRVRGCELHLRAVMRDWANAYEVGGTWMVVPGANDDKFLCAAKQGKLSARCEWKHDPFHDQVVGLDLFLAPDATGAGVLAIASDEVAPRLPAALPAFDDAVKRVHDEFARFLAAFAPVEASLTQTRDLVAYVLWVSTVAPRGFFKTNAVLMSKNWMDHVWSWDHCFTALGLARAHPDLAWQQFLLPFRVQHPSGLLPDAIDGRTASWLCTKSPMHGWTLLRLLQMTDAITNDHLREAYEPLSLWATFWLRERDFDGSGVPYFINGNEQFDNTTLFQVHAPYQGADLCAYLVLLQEALALIATRLGQNDEARRWRAGAQTLQQKIVPHFWRGDQFIAPRLSDGVAAPNECLFRFTPLVLGERLPRAVTDVLRRDLRAPGRWRTPSGALATEALDSPFYDPNSYVRGPIWAPPNLIIHDGLRALGDHELADSVRSGFLAVCMQSGMAECFDARTAKARRDPAYTWTPGAFLALAND